jgi:hypothetical protein
MLLSYKRGQTSVILRAKVLDSSSSLGAGLTGLAYSSSGLIISTIADNEASGTAYTATNNTIEAINTLGTYETPTLTKCRFGELDPTNHKGVYEMQFVDTRFAISGAKSLLVSILGATNCAETDCLIPLTDFDPYDSMRGGLTSLPNVIPDGSGGLPTSYGSGVVGIDWSNIENTTSTVDLSATTFAGVNENIYSMNCQLFNNGSINHVGVQWYKNGIPLTAGVTSPTITMHENSASGTVVSDFSSGVATMTGVSGYGGEMLYELVSELTNGVIYTVVCTATIDAVTQTDFAFVGYDA